MQKDILAFQGPGELLAVVATILGGLEEGVQVVDERGYTIFYNEPAEKLDGLRREEVLGRHVLEVFPSLTAETSTLLKVLQIKKPIYNQQQTFRNFKGNPVVTVNSTLPILLEDRLIGAVEIARNITRVKELAERVVDLQAELFQRGKGVKDQAVGVAQYTFDDLVGVSKDFVEVKFKAARAAVGSSPVLIYGETGSGKELFIQAIHNASPRRDGPFVAQNCAAIPESLLEGILFGTVKGSFTGAENRAGLFELAHQGSLFLDEINSMQPDLQAKLLRVLQEGYVRRVGDSRLRPINVRVVAAANMDPLEAVTQGKLRADLYYRLNVVSLKLPPLRDRVEDIPLLVQHFVSKYNRKSGLQVLGVEPEVTDLFKSYDWPGNVRELEFALEGAMNIMEGRIIKAAFLPERIRNWAKSGRRMVREVWQSKGTEMPKQVVQADCTAVPEQVGTADQTAVPVTWPWVEAAIDSGNTLSLREALERIEKDLVRRAMEKAGGNVSRAARFLGIPRQTLQYKLGREDIKQQGYLGSRN